VKEECQYVMHVSWVRFVGCCLLVIWRRSFDWQIFTGVWSMRLTMVTPQGRVRITPEGFILIIVSFLVLGFLFGERTLRNIVPAVLSNSYGEWTKGMPNENGIIAYLRNRSLSHALVLES